MRVKSAVNVLNLFRTWLEGKWLHVVVNAWGEGVGRSRPLLSIAARSVWQRRDGHDSGGGGGGGGRARGVVAPQSVSVVPPARRETPGTRRVDEDACVASVACVSACQCCCVVSVSRCRVRDVFLFSGQYPMFFSEVAEHANNARSQQYSQQCLNSHKLISFFYIK